jgi:TonB family protein
MERISLVGNTRQSKSRRFSRLAPELRQICPSGVCKPYCLRLQWRQPSLRLEVCMAETWKQWEGTIVDGKFRLEQFLGGSDHSAVFLTAAGTPPAKAAIKFVPANPQALDFHRATWEQTSRLSHPHLIRVFGSGQCRLGNVDLLFVVMEYAEENLGQILPDRALTADETRDTLGPVLETLKYLHEKKLAHGSLKASNIMAVQDQLKLSSDQVRGFGKAGLANDTSVFAAPELASQGAAAASDVWSLGATLVEVLTQRVPERISPRQLVVPGSLPEPFREIAGACLMESPKDRWTLAQIIERLGGAHSSAKPAEQPSPAAVASKSSPPPGAGAARRVPAEPPVVRERAPVELGSGRKLMVSGISFLLVLGAIYLGTQFLHRDSHDNAAGSARESMEKSAVPGASNSTASSSTGGTDSRNAPAKSSPAEPAAPSASASSPGRVLERVEPDVSASARATITGKIHVRIALHVDPSGKVVEARLISAGPSNYFASHALEAARRWTFVPPQADGQPAASKWTLTFTFTRRGVDESAQAN